ncbi:MAG TPA: ATP-binding protein [Burkholderiaceae bacterium]
MAIVGAESTGKTTLAVALERALARDFGLHCVRVGEYLREWCDVNDRTPRPDEQAPLAREQQRRIDAAAATPGVEVVLCDTTPLMTAVYSELLFDDCSLYAFAAEAQWGVDLTLLTALDLPWVADGLQRDGPHVRAPVDAAVRARLLDWGLRWSLVSGVGGARTDAALDALRPLLRRRARHAGAGSGLFRRLMEASDQPQRPAWRCELCDDPACEHLGRDVGEG